MERRPFSVKTEGADYEIRVVGARPTPLRDFYHALLRASWWATVGAISGAYLAANALFAAAFMVTGGVAGGLEHAGAASFRDAFFFSVQTMGTIGYGAMFPRSTAANVVVVVESIVSLLLTALATGLVFAKFSRSRARFMFTRQVTISPMNGAPTLTLRLGNERGNQIVDAHIRMVLTRTERTSEGRTFYRMLDLVPTRDRVPALSRSWTVLHRIDATSPLHGETPASMAEKDAELGIMVVGLDETSMQTVHVSHRYFARDIIWGARHADVLTETPEGHLVLDLHRFHDLEPTEPTVDFPYPST
jgi:inward rectifier potassium channel